MIWLTIISGLVVHNNMDYIVAKFEDKNVIVCVFDYSPIGIKYYNVIIEQVSMKTLQVTKLS